VFKKEKMQELSIVLDQRVDIWGNVPIENELGENDLNPAKIKTIWAAFIPQTGSLQKQQAETIISNVTHKVITSYGAGKDITQDMYIVFREQRFDIKYILNPYFRNQSLELFVEQVIE
jgi:SPP1 family predicted phage head-tail adaptor